MDRSEGRQRRFVAAARDNWLAVLSEEDTRHKRFVRVHELGFLEHSAIWRCLRVETTIYLFAPRLKLFINASCSAYAGLQR